MTKLDTAAWKGLRERIGARERLALFSDFDGTLSPIVRGPEGARLDTGMERVLDGLTRSSRIKLAVISGRALEDLGRRVALDGAYLSGSHGIEIEGPMISFVHPLAAERAETKSEIARRLRSRFAGSPGVFVEEKPYSIACHYRGVREPRGGAIFRGIRDALPSDFEGWRILRGREVVEILPVRGWTKGSCAKLLLAHYRAAEAAWTTALPVAIGDDTTDQDLFREVSPSGVCIAVGGSARLRADYTLGDVAEVRWFLSRILDEYGA